MSNGMYVRKTIAREQERSKVKKKGEKGTNAQSKEVL